MTLRLTDITKRFGQATALDGVTFDVAPGEIHALLGENGAGKTTLMRIAAGLLTADAGQVSVDGVAVTSPAVARRRGVGMVHQHFTSIPALSVGENVALSAGWRETGRRAEQRAASVIARLGLPLDPSRLARELSAQLRQRLEIVQALAGDARVLLLDEPTAVLAPREVVELLALVRHLAAAGAAVVLISHKLSDVLQVADRVTVLRRGRVTLAAPMAGHDAASLSRAMIGGEVERTPTVRGVPGEPRVVLEGGLVLHSGEIVGVAAIEGNGQRELLRAIAGVDGTPSELSVTGRVAFIPEDRTTEAVIDEFTLEENLLLGELATTTDWIDWRALRSRTTSLVAAFDVRGGGAADRIGALSGGNQQKFVLARALEGEPAVVVAEDPTRGLDVQAMTAVHRRLRAAAAGGSCVVVHSSDLDEVLELADRLLVIAGGVIQELAITTPRDQVGDAMLGVRSAP